MLTPEESKINLIAHVFTLETFSYKLLFVSSKSWWLLTCIVFFVSSGVVTAIVDNKSSATNLNIWNFTMKK